MPETAPSTEGTPTPAPVPAPPAEAQTIESLPQWAQETIKSLRDEAAGHRVRAREAAEQATKTANDAAAAKIAELTAANEAAKTDLELAQRNNLRLRAVLEAGVPGEHAADIAERVQGNTEEEIKGDAKRLKELMNIGSPAPTDPTQGRGTNDGTLPLNGDPLLQALHNKLGIGH